jgi:serine/threonine-protein kinase HipA
MMRSANVYKQGVFTGRLIQDDIGYCFEYDDTYLASDQAKSISLSLPMHKAIHRSNVLFPFFDGLIPEGWLLAFAQEHWKLNPRDRMGLLLACCKENIGDISVEEIKDTENA